MPDGLLDQLQDLSVCERQGAAPRILGPPLLDRMNEGMRHCYNRYVTAVLLTPLPAIVHDGGIVIETRGVGKIYYSPTAEFQALQDVDINVSAGEVFGIIGRSG